MSETNNGGPAFPSTDVHGFIGVGLSIRDYFAGQALLQAYLQWIPGETNFDKAASHMAQECYLIADAMLIAREPKTSTTTAQQIALGIGGAK